MVSQKTIQYTLKVRLMIYHTLAQDFCTLVNEDQTSGHRQVMWSGKNNAVPTGLYLYRIVACDFVKSQKRMPVK